MPPTTGKHYCVGAPAFDPATVNGDEKLPQQISELLEKDDLYGASRVLLKLTDNDGYVYHATSSVRLAEVQHIVQLGGINGLHNWYRTVEGTPVCSARCDELHKPSVVNMQQPKARSTTALRHRCLCIDI